MATVTGTQSTFHGAGIEQLLSGYRALPGVHDELVDHAARIRPHWLPLLHELARLGNEELTQRFALADQHLTNSGVFHRVYDDGAGAERQWPLSHMPIVMAPNDWADISAGLTQRAELLESILADCYGPANLVNSGALPAAMIAGSPEFIRPLHGCKPRGGRHLMFYAANIARGTDGRWHVIRDRTQAPTGAGFALENRLALSRALGDVFKVYEVERLAQFFYGFRSVLSAHRDANDAGVCLLSPGALNEAYFEHAYLARYLGFRLVEGQDLTTRQGRLFLRTISGLRPINVLWRRIDSDFADPLELNPASRLGVPGLLQSIRQGHVVSANAIGSGLTEVPALQAWIPRLAEAVLGEPLLLPGVQTWWCGHEPDREHVLANFDRLAISKALVPPRVGQLGEGVAAGGRYSAEERQRLVEDISERGYDFIAQEPVQFSTTPVWVDGRLEPRPFMMRVFVAAAENGWTVLPGGLGLIGLEGDTSVVTLQRGARSADVWVTSDRPVSATTLLTAPESVAIRRATGALPSRAADNLFWLARYMERAEMTTRLIRSLAARISGRGVEGRADTQALVELLIKWGATATEQRSDPMAAAAEAFFDRGRKDSVLSLITSARQSAFVIRDRFPPDAWRAIEDLNAYVAIAAKGRVTQSDLLEKAGTALRIMAAVAGLELENMNRLTGWRFLQLGGSIERAIATCRSARQLGSRDSPPACLDALLDLADCQITYRVRYLHGASRLPVLDLVVFDDSNPRSLAFLLDETRSHLRALPEHDGDAAAGLDLIEALIADLASLALEALDGAKLLGFENRLMRLSNEISDRYFGHLEPSVAWPPGERTP